MTTMKTTVKAATSYDMENSRRFPGVLQVSNEISCEVVKSGMKDMYEFVEFHDVAVSFIPFSGALVSVLFDTFETSPTLGFDIEKHRHGNILTVELLVRGGPPPQ